MSYQPKTGQPCDCKRGIERDNCPACEGQIRAFGSADLGYGPELGYSSIKEPLDHDVELDFLLHSE